MNDCPFPPTKVCVGLHPGRDALGFDDWNAEPLTLVIVCCELHAPAVLDLVSEYDPEAALCVDIAALPSVLDELGPNVWTVVPDAA